MLEFITDAIHLRSNFLAYAGYGYLVVGGVYVSRDYGLISTMLSLDLRSVFVYCLSLLVLNNRLGWC